MKHLLCLILPLLLALSTSALAADSLSTEVDRLLADVEGSKCIFIRNGKEHSAADAAAHMRKKRDHFRDQIRTAEDFIRLAGTKSELTGRPYLIRCGGNKPQPTAAWLTRELAKHRQTNRR